MRARSLLLLCGIALAVLLPSPSHAEDATPPSAPSPQPPQPPASSVATVTPPVLVKDDGAAYPKQALEERARGGAEVLLLLTIDSRGAVTRATVETPVGHGFDEAAVAAAMRLVFSPATRDGRPVAARIRFLYRFPPPPAALAGRVVTLSGERPLAGATVVIRSSTGAEHTVTTGIDGTWRVDALTAGTYHVTVSANGKIPHEADQNVQPGEEALAIDRLAPERPAASLPATHEQGEEIEENEVHGVKPPREVVKR
ncbi:MAG: TonB family protein, partial [Polyangiaceae bacterium]